MGILGDIAKVATVVANPAGALAGVGVSLLASKGPQILSEFTKNPVAALTNPMSLPSQFADGVLGKLGIKADFRNLAQFAGNPMGSIADALKNPAQLVFGGIGATVGAMLNPQLKTNGSDVVDTGRYLISMKEDSVKVYDKQTNTWVNAYGDPHVRTSDGDKGQFHDKPLTLQLQDGTKVTIDPKKLPNGTAVIENVVINKGNEAVVVSGFNDGKAGLDATKRTGFGAMISDAMQPDGTVLRAGHEVDDLFAVNGKEFRGSDPTKPFGEIDLDHIADRCGTVVIKPGGGKPPITVTPGKPDPSSWPQEVKDLIATLKDMIAGLKPGGAGGTGGAGGSGGTGGTGGAGGTKPAEGSKPVTEASKPGGAGGTSSAGGVTGSSVMSRIMEILAKLQDKLEAKAEELAGVEDEGKLRQGMFELQQLQNMIQQITSMATNIQKTHHDSAMGIIRNFN